MCQHPPVKCVTCMSPVGLADVARKIFTEPLILLLLLLFSAWDCPKSGVRGPGPGVSWSHLSSRAEEPAGATSSQHQCRTSRVTGDSRGNSPFRSWSPNITFKWIRVKNDKNDKWSTFHKAVLNLNSLTRQFAEFMCIFTFVCCLLALLTFLTNQTRAVDSLQSQIFTTFTSSERKYSSDNCLIGYSSDKRNKKWTKSCIYLTCGHSFLD